MFPVNRLWISSRLWCCAKVFALAWPSRQLGLNALTSTSLVAMIDKRLGYVKTKLFEYAYLKLFWIYISVTDLRSNILNAPPPGHAVFGEIWPNNRLVPLLGLAPPPRLGNPGSTAVFKALGYETAIWHTIQCSPYLPQVCRSYQPTLMGKKQSTLMGKKVNWLFLISLHNISLESCTKCVISR